jgi:hypothetical protein
MIGEMTTLVGALVLVLVGVHCSFARDKKAFLYGVLLLLDEIEVYRPTGSRRGLMRPLLLSSRAIPARHFAAPPPPLHRPALRRPERSAQKAIQCLPPKALVLVCVGAAAGGRCA